MALTRDQIVAEALDLLDEVGLEGLSLRRLADRLDVQAPSLYWHVRDKRELLDLMADRIVGRSPETGVPVPKPGQPWWEWLAEGSRALRASLLAHRDGALVVSGNRPTADVLPAIEARLGALVDFGFAPKHALLAVLSLSSFVVGEVLERQAEVDRDPPVSPELTARLQQDDLSFLRAAMSGEPLDDAERFEHGLETMIAGLRARFDAGDLS